MSRNNNAAPTHSRTDQKWQPHWRIFRGAYKTSSPEYRVSKTNAPMPPSYHRQILLFHGIFETPSPVIFNVGQPITVAIDHPGQHEGHSLYGFVYDVESSLWKGRRQGYYWQMEVEVHTIPGYAVDWRHARPFTTPPVGTVFVQPHGFCEANFELLSPSSPERWRTVKVDLGQIARLFEPSTRIYRMVPPETRVLPPGIYPQSTQHGPLIPARTLIEEVQRVTVEPPQPRREEGPDHTIRTFNSDMEYIHSQNVRSTGNKRKYNEFVVISDDEEDNRRIRRRAD